MRLSRRQYIAKNVRHLYGLPPDTNWNHRRRCSRDVYGQYYTFLATKWRETCGKVASVTLIEYMYLTGMVTRRKERALLARLPNTEYLRGGQCKHESVAVLHSFPQTRPGMQDEMRVAATIQPADTKKPVRSKNISMMQNIAKQAMMMMINRPASNQSGTAKWFNAKPAVVRQAKLKNATTNT